ncbi:alpha/beta hydrolase [Sneathiella sp.]|uniref:alpha/beta hydrolase n=1 Tax=Sneathiella sp. TaxID=1964365 RepID=UPI0035661C85
MRLKFLSIFPLLGPFMLSACTSTAIVVANAPTSFFDGTIERDVVYDDINNQKLDIYIPDLAAQKKLPVIIFFYGGRWTDGKKEDFAFVGTTLADKGFVVVIPDYRKYPDVRFPTFVDDGAHAVNWVHDNIENYRGQSRALFLAGHSAGGHIASLLVADERYLRADTLSAIKGFAGLAGPYAFTPEDEDLKDMFGPPSQYPQMQATTFIDGREPPMLLLYGSNDTTVELYNLKRLEQKIQEYGGQVQTKIYPDVDHIEIVGALSWVWRSKASVAEDIAVFFHHLVSAARGK